jgi:YesN/AraC family two-component response regulator
MKKTQILSDNGISKNEGRNVGQYPLHSFITNPKMENALRMPLRADFAGHDEWVKGCWRKRTNSELFAIEFIREGGMRVKQDDKSYTATPGCVFLVHTGKTSEMKTDAYCMKLTASLSGAALAPLLNILKLDEIDVISLKDELRLESMMKKLISILKDKPEDFQAKSSETAYSILLELAREHGKNQYPDLLNKTLELLEKSASRQLTLNEICKAVGSSPSTLNRLFKKHFNSSPIEYFIEMKMKAAQNMLRNETLSIKEISEKLGYSNQLYFSAEFKKKHGRAPSFFRLNK